MHMQDFLEAFLTDAFSSLENIRSALTILRDQPQHREAAYEAMRLFHSLRGAAAMMEQKEMSAVCQAQETRFRALYDGKTSIGPEVIAGALQDIERMRQALETQRASL